MRVSQVTVSATRSNGNFGNDKIEVVVDLGEGDSPVEAYKRARAFVLARLSGAESRLDRLRVEKNELELKLATAEGELAGGFE